MDKKMKSSKNPLVRFRGWIQAAATLLTNIHIPNLFKGKIYQGNVKTMCVPGLNCYSCPAATGACPIGAFQAVVGSSKFKFIYSILYKPCIFKAYRLLNVQTLCIFPCFCPYEPKQGKFLFSADYLIQQSCGSTLRFPCSVSVNVHCGTDISVSEKFLHIFRCCTV